MMALVLSACARFAPHVALAPLRTSQPRLSLSRDERDDALNAKLNAMAAVPLGVPLYVTEGQQSHLLERDALVGTISSSELLAKDEAADLWPPNLSTTPQSNTMLFIDELSCIGCGYCPSIARSTFTLANGDEDYGTARAVQQGGDEDAVVDEAIAACPADCIHMCSREELEILEEHRELYLNDVLAAWSTRRLVGQDGGGGTAAPHWKDPLINTGWRKGAAYTRTGRRKLVDPRVQ